MGRLDNKVCIVTGASAGIGRATAVLFAQEGAKVLAAARREDRLKELCDECAGLPGTVAYCVADGGGGDLRPAGRGCQQRRRHG